VPYDVYGSIFRSPSLPLNPPLGVWTIVHVFFDDLALKNADENFIERQSVCVRFFISVICNPYPIVADRVDNIFKVHLALYLGPCLYRIPS
jgi:hypothetical protein